MEKKQKDPGWLRYRVFLAVCIICALAGSVFSVYRKYRVYRMTYRDIRSVLSVFGGEQEEETGYEYVDKETGNKINKESPVHYYNCTPGQEAAINAGYNTYPVNIRFIPEYVNGTLLPDGSQEKYVPRYTYEADGKSWSRDYPYSYKDRQPGKEYTANLSEDVSFTYTAQYVNGYVYPDGSQEELH